MASDARSRTSTSAKSAIKNRRDMADTPFTLAGVMRRADARRVAVQILLTRFCLNFQGKPCTSCLSKNYPELFALMGGQVPDLRGLFLRGHGGNSAALGVTQGHAMRDISASGSISVGFGGYLSGSGIFKPVGSHKVTVIRGTWDNNWSSTNYGLDLSAGGVPVANEVRPDNQAVRYLIRAIP
nr:MAG TPA: short tail fiber protein [Caudoviricetes sp.]